MLRHLVGFCVLLLPVAGFAQPAQETEGERRLPAARRFEVRRATSPIRVDGVLDEQAWADALVFDLPYEWSPGDNTPPPVKTDFLLTYDDERLYAAWRAFDPEPAAIRAHLMDRDATDTLVQDDHVTLMIDPFNDERRGFQFRVNPLGVQADAIFSQNEGVEDFSFDMIWASAARITAEGYVVEIAIPLDQIRFPRTDGAQTWGVDVGRSYPRNVRHRISGAPIARGNNCILCQASKVTGFEGLKPGRNLEVTPTVTAKRTDEAASLGGRLETGDEEIGPGVTARWGITPNIALSATINPDFSQVEADVAQLDVNERFALFFPEKRPFFLEGIDVFSTPLQAVFTRTVVDPDWGLKVTGKEGRNAFGVFANDDQVNSFLIPSNQGTDFILLEDESVTSGVVRYRRDVGANSTLGALVTAREGDDYHNRVFGLDSFFRFDAANTLAVQYLRSDTLYPREIATTFRQSRDAFQGDALLIDYDYSGPSWFWSLDYEDRDPEFRADSGFIPRVDIREGRAFVQRQIYGEQDDWYTQWNIGLSAQRTEDYDGDLTDERIDLFTNISGPRQSLLELSADRNTERVRNFFGDVLYEGMSRGQVFFRMQPNRVALVSLFADFGETVDVNNNQAADLFEVTPTAELKLGQHINARIEHTLQRLDVEGGELFEANLTQLRLIYNFNVRTFVRGIFQYLDLQRDTDLFRPEIRRFFDPETEELFTQLLFSYKLNPQTVLFLGYSDTQEGNQLVERTRTVQTFFFKVGYAWIL